MRNPTLACELLLGSTISWRKCWHPPNKVVWNHSGLFCLTSIIARHRRPFILLQCRKQAHLLRSPAWNSFPITEATPCPPWRILFIQFYIPCVECLQTLDQCPALVATNYGRASAEMGTREVQPLPLWLWDLIAWGILQFYKWFSSSPAAFYRFFSLIQMPMWVPFWVL